MFFREKGSQQCVCGTERKINLYDYAPKKKSSSVSFLENNGQIQAVRMTGAQFDFAPPIIVGKCCVFSIFSRERDERDFTLSLFSLSP
jgi:hypothetical protein